MLWAQALVARATGDDATYRGHQQPLYPRQGSRDGYDGHLARAEAMSMTAAVLSGLVSSFSADRRASAALCLRPEIRAGRMRLEAALTQDGMHPVNTSGSRVCGRARLIG